MIRTLFPQQPLSARQLHTTSRRDMTLWDAMVAMYEKYGYYKDAVKSIGLSGIEGLAKIQSIMEHLEIILRPRLAATR